MGLQSAIQQSFDFKRFDLALIGTVEAGAYDVDTETLSLPEVVIDGKVAYRDVVFRVADSAGQLFVLLSARRDSGSHQNSSLHHVLMRHLTEIRNCFFILNGFRREFYVYYLRVTLKMAILPVLWATWWR